jgi:Protein of unknown function (DUF664)
VLRRARPGPKLGRVTWTAPDQTRTDPPTVAPERAALEGWLEYHRSTLLAKCQGLTGEQLAQRAVPPSSLSLLGLVRHMTDVERAWFRIRAAGDSGLRLRYATDKFPDGDFDFAEPSGAETDLATYREECELARAAMLGRSLDDTFVDERDGTTLDLRWVYLHMIEEYARHNGHADLLRERIDGVTGS